MTNNNDINFWGKKTCTEHTYNTRLEYYLLFLDCFNQLQPCNCVIVWSF